MQCDRHNERTAVCQCSKCGRNLCNECAIDINGKILCKQCIEESMNDRGYYTDSNAGKGLFGSKSIHYDTTKCTGRKYNGLILLITSMILPGLGFMYLGLIKRGLFFLASFFLLSYCASMFHAPLIGMGIAVLWITSVFDSFKKMRALLAGVHVEDSAREITNYIAKNKVMFIIIVILALFCGSSSNSIHVPMLFHGFYGFGSLIRSFIPVIIIVGIFRFIFHHHRHDNHNR